MLGVVSQGHAYSMAAAVSPELRIVCCFQHLGILFYACAFFLAGDVASGGSLVYGVLAEAWFLLLVAVAFAPCLRSALLPRASSSCPRFFGRLLLLGLWPACLPSGPYTCLCAQKRDRWLWALCQILFAPMVPLPWLPPFGPA